MSRGILVFPFVHVCVDLVASAPLRAMKAIYLYIYI